MKVANVMSAVVFLTLAVSGAAMCVDYGVYTVVAFILFAVTTLFM